MYKKSDWPSFVILRSLLKSYFLDQPTAHIGQGHEFIFPAVGPVNVVLFGDAPLALLNVSRWPNLPFKLWTLSHCHRQLLSYIFGISPEHIGVVPRYKLFPLRNPAMPFPSAANSLRLVSASKASTAKQVFLSIKIANYFQTKMSPNTELDICGPHLNPDYDVRLKTEINNLNWLIKPQVHGDLGVNWKDRNFESPCLINLSLAASEDFGVSVAQAQQLGWPLILSDWGAHKDVVGTNVLKLPAELIYMESVSEIAHRILNFRGHPYPDRSNAQVEPKVFSRENLAEKVKSVNKKKISSFASFFNSEITALEIEKQILEIMS